MLADFIASKEFFGGFLYWVNAYGLVAFHQIALQQQPIFGRHLLSDFRTKKCTWAWATSWLYNKHVICTILVATIIKKEF